MVLLARKTAELSDTFVSENGRGSAQSTGRVPLRTNSKHTKQKTANIDTGGEAARGVSKTNLATWSTAPNTTQQPVTNRALVEHPCLDGRNFTKFTGRGVGPPTRH